MLLAARRHRGGRIRCCRQVRTSTKTHPFKRDRILCQNCVTSPRKPWVNTMIYGDTPTRIDVAEIVGSELCWWDFVCVSTRGGNQFPSVLLEHSEISPHLSGPAPQPPKVDRSDESGAPGWTRTSIHRLRRRSRLLCGLVSNRTPHSRGDTGDAGRRCSGATRQRGDLTRGDAALDTLLSTSVTSISSVGGDRSPHSTCGLRPYVDHASRASLQEHEQDAPAITGTVEEGHSQREAA